MYLKNRAQYTKFGSTHMTSELFSSPTTSPHVSDLPVLLFCSAEILKFETQLWTEGKESARGQKQIKGIFFLILLNPLKLTRMTAKRNSYADRRASVSDCKDILKSKKNAYWISTAVENPHSFSE